MQGSPAILTRGRYRLLDRLGEGADCVVYRVRDAWTGEVVALKALRAEADGDARERLRLEFARLSALRHPHLLAVRDLQVAGPADTPLRPGQLFFTADHVAGPSARARFLAIPAQERPAEAIRLLGEVAAALAAIHSVGLVHGDVKPDNILCGPDGARLCDLGLARFRSVRGVAAGTPAYLAPEALCGEADARADLWSLGVTIWELVEGQTPFPGAPPELYQHILRAPLPRATRMSADLLGVVERLIERDLGLRYARAEIVLAEAARLRGDPAAAAELATRKRPLLRPALCGRAPELARLMRWLEALEVGAAPRAVAVVGAPGSGKTRLIGEAIRAHQTRAVAGLLAPLEFVAGVEEWTDGAADLDVAVERILSTLAGRDRPVVLHLRRTDADPLAEKLVLAHRRDAEARALLIVIEGEAVPGAWLDEFVELGPLSDADGTRLIESMAGQAAPAEEAAALLRSSGGLPGLLEQIVRARHAGIDPESAADVRRLIARRMGALAGPVRAAAEALSVMGRPARPADVAALLGVAEADAYAALQVLCQEALCDEVLGRFTVRGAAAADAALGGIEPGRARRLHALAAGRLGAQAPARVRARHAEALLPPARAATLAQRAGQEALVALALPEAIGHLEFALRFGAAKVRERAALSLCAAHALSGDYPRALKALERGGNGEAVRLERGRLLVRTGKDQDAEDRLRPLALSRRPDTRLEARALLGRVAIARGQADRARRLCGDPRALPATPGGAAASEVAGLARLQLGDLSGARACFLRIVPPSRGGDSAPPRRAARMHGLLGMVAHEEGDFSTAAAAYATAHELATGAGDVHLQATFASNLASVDVERGRYGDALGRVALAARQLGRLGRTTEWAFALFNHGNLLARLGDLPGGREMLRRARQAAEAGGERMEGHAASLQGDLACAEGSFEDAVRAYRQAVDRIAAQPGPPGPLGEALLGLAAALREVGRPAEADPVLARAAAVATTALGRDRVTLERARLDLALRRTAPGIEDELRPIAARLREGGAVGELWRAELVLALVLQAHNKETAGQALERAREAFKEVVMATPDPYREGLLRDPEARRLLQVPAASAAAPRALATPAEGRLRRLLAINKRLNSEQRLPRLLEYIVDTVIELCDAERGFLVLVDERGGMHVRTARNISAQTLAADEFSLSRSIAEQAARGGEPIVTVDAAADDRFSDKKSVSALRLRSVLAAPLRVKGKVVGTLYVDHRLRRGAFSDEDVATVLDFCDQAAIAIDNANMAVELRRQAREIDRIRRELERRVERREAELAELRTEVVQSRDALQARYRYESLVGRSRPMRDLFALLDRVTQTELPVVVCGESGTGKELVARALHSNGPRRERAFVSENCSAIPETLLESILFGHVRGAFTGADRDRRGLFEVADGGTLFLDEVGEMSAAMQSKLLRVLQEGDFRRVGGEAVLRASVRVVAASNRDLRKLVAEGRFREDLYYRLSVVRVDVPPLRDRREDIPLLAEHFLAKHFPAGERAVEPDAMRALLAYRWPGNVRELENVVLRAAALSDGPIRLADLPAEVQPGSAAASDPNDLRIRHRVADLERELIRTALERARGNQSQAARELGISRFGLHKKMQRFHIRVAT